MSIRLGAFFAVVPLLFGCGGGVSVHVTQLSAAYPSLSPETEILVSSVGVPQCPFEEVGLVTVLGWNKGEELLEVMVAEARRLGGHALVGLDTEPETESSAKGLTATAIRYTDADCRHDSQKPASVRSPSNTRLLPTAKLRGHLP